jgi:hypothetical protein
MNSALRTVALSVVAAGAVMLLPSTKVATKVATKGTTNGVVEWSGAAPVFVPEVTTNPATEFLPASMTAAWPASYAPMRCFASADGSNWIAVGNYTANDGGMSTTVAGTGLVFKLGN